MTLLELSFACSRYDRTEAILDGRVKPDGINFIATTAQRPGEIFWRVMKYNEFDCAEIGLNLLLSEQRDWIGIPVFTAKHFFHTDFLINRHSGIKEPLDLEGKKVGLPLFGQTAALWVRGIMKDEYGLRSEKIHWYQGRTMEKSTRQGTRGFEISYNDGISLGEALSRGDLDALAVYSSTSSIVDATNPDLSINPNVTTLFEDQKAEAIRYFKKSGIFPINHTVVLRKSLFEQHPWIAINIYKAFEESKKIAYGNWHALESWEKFPSAIFLSNLLQEQRMIFGGDPFANGIDKNRKTVETLARYLLEEGRLQDPIQIDSKFAESTLKL